MSKPTIFYGTIAWRALEVHHVKSVLQLMTNPAGRSRLTISPQAGDAAVDRARSVLATRFLDSGYDVLMSVDSDIVFNADDVFTVCEQAEEYGIVAGAYVTRNYASRPIPASHFELDQRVVLGGADGTPVPIRWPAGGFCAVHRRVFEAVRDAEKLPLLNAKEPTPFYPFYLPFWVEHEGETIYLSEDWAFAERARRAGFPAYLNPAVRLQHFGVYGFQQSDMLRAPLPDDPVEVTRLATTVYHAELIESAPIG